MAFKFDTTLSPKGSGAGLPGRHRIGIIRASDGSCANVIEGYLNASFGSDSDAGGDFSIELQYFVLVFYPPDKIEGLGHYDPVHKSITVNFQMSDFEYVYRAFTDYKSELIIECSWNERNEILVADVGTYLRWVEGKTGLA